MSHGGKRSGAGRPKGTGRFKGEQCERVYVPAQKKDEVFEYLETDGYAIPYFENAVPAGSATLNESSVTEKKNILSLLTMHPLDTFLVPVTGRSMIYANIQEGDILVVDSKLEAVDGSIVVASVDNECTVKRLRKRNGHIFLMPENPEYAPIQINEFSDVRILGVVKKKIGDVA
jgi:DNA polymerase V